MFFNLTTRLNISLNSSTVKMVTGANIESYISLEVKETKMDDRDICETLSALADDLIQGGTDWHVESFDTIKEALIEIKELRNRVKDLEEMI